MSIMNMFDSDPYSFSYDLSYADILNNLRRLGLKEKENNNVPEMKAPPPVPSFRPRMDLYEDPHSNVVTVILELPGMRKEWISIELRDEKLYISGERVTTEGWDEDGFAVRERGWGKFKRVVALPKRVKSDEVKARFEDGLLTITFPRAVPEEARTKISIDA